MIVMELCSRFGQDLEGYYAVLEFLFCPRFWSLHDTVEVSIFQKNAEIILGCCHVIIIHPEYGKTLLRFRILEDF